MSIWLLLVNFNQLIQVLSGFFTGVVTILPLKLTSNLWRDTLGLSKYPVPHQAYSPKFSNHWFLPKPFFARMVAKWWSSHPILLATIIDLYFTVRKSPFFLSPIYLYIYYLNELMDSYLIQWAIILYSPDLFLPQKLSQTWAVGSPSNLLLYPFNMSPSLFLLFFLIYLLSGTSRCSYIPDSFCVFPGQPWTQPFLQRALILKDKTVFKKIWALGILLHFKWRIRPQMTLFFIELWVFYQVVWDNIFYFYLFQIK